MSGYLIQRIEKKDNNRINELHYALIATRIEALNAKKEEKLSSLAIGYAKSRLSKLIDEVSEIRDRPEYESIKGQSDLSKDLIEQMSSSVDDHNKKLDQCCKQTKEKLASLNKTEESLLNSLKEAGVCIKDSCLSIYIARHKHQMFLSEDDSNGPAMCRLKLVDAIKGSASEYFKLNEDNVRSELDFLVTSGNALSDDSITDLISYDDGVRIYLNFNERDMEKLGGFLSHFTQAIKHESVRAAMSYYNPRTDIPDDEAQKELQEYAEGLQPIVYIEGQNGYQVFERLLKGEPLSSLMKDDGSYRPFNVEKVGTYYEVNGHSDKSIGVRAWMDGDDKAMPFLRSFEGYHNVNLESQEVFLQENPELKVGAEKIIEAIKRTESRIENDSSFSM